MTAGVKLDSACQNVSQGEIDGFMKPASCSRTSWFVTRALWLSVCALTAVAYAGCGGTGLFGSGSTQIGGTVVVGTTSVSVVAGTASGGSVTPSSTVVPGATVWLEQQSRGVVVAGGFAFGTVLVAMVENLIDTTTADSKGKFKFNVVPQGTYEIVADVASMPTNENPSNATITTGVRVTSSGGPGNLMIPLVAESGSSALVQGLFSTNGLSSATISYIGGQFFNGSNGEVLALIPLLNFSGIPSTPTGLNPGTNCTGALPCPFGTLCACYLISLPASNPVTGAANSSGTGYSWSSSGSVVYSVDAAAALGSAQDCNPSELVSTSFTVASGATTTAPEIDFTGCQ